MKINFTQIFTNLDLRTICLDMQSVFNTDMTVLLLLITQENFKTIDEPHFEAIQYHDVL